MCAVSSTKATLSNAKGSFAILFGTKEMNNIDHDARQAGIKLAEIEIEEMYIKSEYFREVSAIKELKPLVDEIINKRARSLEDVNFHYDIVDFKHDQEMVRSKIEKFNIKITAEDLFTDEESKLRTGTLLWYYNSYLQFSLQWLFINIAWAIIVFFVIKYCSFNFRYGPWDDRKTLFGFGVAFNSWIFVIRPKGFSLLYWYPFLIILLTYFFLFILKKGHNQIRKD